jgi:hypothetical protein
MDLYLWMGDAPALFSGSNTYLNVVADVATCASGSVSKKGNAAARRKLPGQFAGTIVTDLR